MIRIHRSKPVVAIGRQRVQLSRAEHQLLVALGMMDNKRVPVQLLIETALDHPVKIPDDREVVWNRIARLRKKIGADRLTGSKHGYMLAGDVQFFG